MTLKHNHLPELSNFNTKRLISINIVVCWWKGEVGYLVMIKGRFSLCFKNSS